MLAVGATNSTTRGPSSSNPFIQSLSPAYIIARTAAAPAEGQPVTVRSAKGASAVSPQQHQLATGEVLLQATPGALLTHPIQVQCLQGSL